MVGGRSTGRFTRSSGSSWRTSRTARISGKGAPIRTAYDKAQALAAARVKIYEGEAGGLASYTKVRERRTGADYVQTAKYDPVTVEEREGGGWIRREYGIYNVSDSNSGYQRAPYISRYVEYDPSGQVVLRKEYLPEGKSGGGERVVLRREQKFQEGKLSWEAIQGRYGRFYHERNYLTGERKDSYDPSAQSPKSKERQEKSQAKAVQEKSGITPEEWGQMNQASRDAVVRQYNVGNLGSTANRSSEPRTRYTPPQAVEKREVYAGRDEKGRVLTKTVKGYTPMVANIGGKKIVGSEAFVRQKVAGDYLTRRYEQGVALGGTASDYVPKQALSTVQTPTGGMSSAYPQEKYFSSTTVTQEPTFFKSGTEETTRTIYDPSPTISTLLTDKPSESYLQGYESITVTDSRVLPSRLSSNWKSNVVEPYEKVATPANAWLRQKMEGSPTYWVVAGGEKLGKETKETAAAWRREGGNTVYKRDGGFWERPTLTTRAAQGFEFYGGVAEGSARRVRTKPLNVALEVGAGVALGGVAGVAGAAAKAGVPAAIKVYRASRVVGYGGAALFGGVTAYRASKADSIGGAGVIVGEAATSAAAFGVGGYVGAQAGAGGYRAYQGWKASRALTSYLSTTRGRSLFYSQRGGGVVAKETSFSYNLGKNTYAFRGKGKTSFGLESKKGGLVTSEGSYARRLLSESLSGGRAVVGTESYKFSITGGGKTTTGELRGGLAGVKLVKTPAGAGEFYVKAGRGYYSGAAKGSTRFYEGGFLDPVLKVGGQTFSVGRGLTYSPRSLGAKSIGIRSDQYVFNAPSVRKANFKFNGEPVEVFFSPKGVKPERIVASDFLTKEAVRTPFKFPTYTRAPPKPRLSQLGQLFRPPKPSKPLYAPRGGVGSILRPFKPAPPTSGVSSGRLQTSMLKTSQSVGLRSLQTPTSGLVRVSSQAFGKTVSSSLKVRGLGVSLSSIGLAAAKPSYKVVAAPASLVIAQPSLRLSSRPALIQSLKPAAITKLSPRLGTISRTGLTSLTTTLTSSKTTPTPPPPSFITPPPTIITPPPFFPWLPSGGTLGSGRRRWSRGKGRKYGYSASLEAIEFGITGGSGITPSGGFTGLEIRPMRGF